MITCLHATKQSTGYQLRPVFTYWLSVVLIPLLKTNFRLSHLSSRLSSRARMASHYISTSTYIFAGIKAYYIVATMKHYYILIWLTNRS